LEEGEEVTVGRGADAAVRIDNPAVSRHHVRLKMHDGCSQLEDLGSMNGTFVNGEKIAGSVAVGAGDRIGVGKFQLVQVDEPKQEAPGPASANFESTVMVRPSRNSAARNETQPHRLVATGGRARPARVSLDGKGVVTIGRDPSCDVVVPGWLVSATHCSVEAKGGVHYLVNHGRWRGTALNGERIRSENRLHRGDTIRIAGARLRYE
jgi:pSer/pThr/pTyr-binding forkhead associated (FHA) protein